MDADGSSDMRTPCCGEVLRVEMGLLSPIRGCLLCVHQQQKTQCHEFSPEDRMDSIQFTDPRDGRQVGVEWSAIPMSSSTVTGWYH